MSIYKGNVLLSGNLQGIGFPNYSSKTMVSSPYTVNNPGIIYVRNVGGAGANDVIVNINNVNVASLVWFAHDSFFVTKGDVVTISDRFEAAFFPLR